ncbi:UNVERIFIED_CONTAM: hypothetical protein GTU68_023447 [Idotea baltica]|nr:hypothetical protein [Idotea baltica]
MDTSFLLSVFVLLAAASVLVPISKLTGLGPVIGYLIAGVLIGPSVLGLISEPETILHFSEFGVVMMLFLIGLELRPQELWDMRGRLLGLGGLQVGLTVVLVTFSAMALNIVPVSALVIGMAFALSSTAVALQIMQERNLIPTTTGQSAFSVLLFQDVIVIAMIASMPVLAVSMGGEEGLWRAAAIIGVFGGMILMGRVGLRPMFRLIARSNVRETFTAIALALVFGAAFLMNWLGLSAALGAFIAGVVLADSEYRHQLERDIEPFKALLLGLFFMSVGMSLKMNVIRDHPGLILGGVIGLMALKFLVLFGVGRIFKLALPSNLLFATLLCQAGEFGFVLFQFAATEHLLTQEQISQLMLICHDRFVAPKFAHVAMTGPEPDSEKRRVLVLGFGRVGQVATRLLHTQDIETTLIDHDGDHIEFVRQFGNRVFYGDAGDVDLLRMAGAATAEVIIVAIDDAGKAEQVAANVKEHFPNAQIVARARNRTGMFNLMAIGVDFVERETVRGALAMGESALSMLGVEPARAKKLADDFLVHDFKLIQETWEHRDDMDTLIKRAEASREFMRRTLNDDPADEDETS